MFDTIVAGAGPAGSIAAIVLARAGARVLLVDRERFPRPKLCGDSVNPGALAVLDRLGLLHVVDGGLPIEGMIVTGEPRVRVVGRYGAVRGRSISRRDLDAALVAAAAAAGARVEEGVLVSGPLLDDGGVRTVAGVVITGRDGRAIRVPAPVVIAADGRASRIARALGLSSAPRWPRRWAVGAYFTGVQGMSSFGEMHVRRGHYVGVAPLAGGVTNACVVSADRRALADAAELLHHVLATDPQLRDRFADAVMISPPVSLGPLAVDARAAGEPGLLLAGDAAGFVDPMTGDGLRFAFRGGELAALAAVQALQSGGADAHVRLAAARRREFAPKWRFNRTLRALVGSPAAVRAAALGAAAAPGVLQRVIAYAGDVKAA